MRGHWLSQTRKLNKHYQSGGTGETLWDPLAGCLCKVTKGGIAYYPAPSYCILNNGTMLQEIFYNRQYSASGVSGIEISEEQVLEYVPYFPKSSDSYFIGTNLNTVTWEAKSAFDVEQPDLQESVVSFAQGDDLSSKNANLLKLTYAGYVLKKSGTSAITSSEFDAVCQMLAQSHGRARIDGRGTFSGTPRQEFYPEWMAGDLSATGTGTGINQMLDFVSNIGFQSYSTTLQAFKYPAMTMYPQYQSTRYWSGVQKVDELFSPSISPYICDIVNGYRGMHGFAYTGSGSTPASLYDPSENARFCPVQVLKKVEGITCPITG